jgi:hypothetical protein
MIAISLRTRLGGDRVLLQSENKHSQRRSIF